MVDGRAGPNKGRVRLNRPQHQVTKTLKARPVHGWQLRPLTRERMSLVHQIFTRFLVRGSYWYHNNKSFPLPRDSFGFVLCRNDGVPSKISLRVSFSTFPSITKDKSLFRNIERIVRLLNWRVGYVCVCVCVFVSILKIFYFRFIIVITVVWNFYIILRLFRNFQSRSKVFFCDWPNFFFFLEEIERLVITLPGYSKYFLNTETEVYMYGFNSQVVNTVY